MLRWTSIPRILRIPQYAYSTANKSAVNVNLPNDKNDVTKQVDQSKLVAAAFASLKDLSAKSKHRSLSSVEYSVINAKDVNSLLETAEQGPISRTHALKIISKLADWANMGQINLSDFETDIRFAKICKILGKSGQTNEEATDLSLVLGITADDQAAKLISSISVSQMIKVMSSLSLKGRRSTPMLRSLSYNISNKNETLTLKQAADVFYSCAVLNFPDDILLAKVTSDILANLTNNKIPIFVSSIVTSAGILKYRDIELFESLTDWSLSHLSLCGQKEYVSLVLALANVNFKPEKFSKLYKILKTRLNEQEMPNAHCWLDVVWALAILDNCEPSFISSTLNPQFIERLKSSSDGLHFATKMKLLNINGIAKSMEKSYNGSLLPEDSIIYDVPLTRSKEKKIMVDAVIETLSNIVAINDYVRRDVDTKMGFLIDAEFRMNSSSQFIELSKPSFDNEKKVAVMVCTYHDFCRGSSIQLSGIVALNCKLLEKNDYKVLIVPFNEFNPRDTLIKRVQYFENKLKNYIHAKK